jgi:hypothetical protein
MVMQTASHFLRLFQTDIHGGLLLSVIQLVFPLFPKMIVVDVHDSFDKPEEPCLLLVAPSRYVLPFKDMISQKADMLTWIPA